MKFKKGDKVIIISKTTGCKSANSAAFRRAQVRGYATIADVYPGIRIYVIGGDSFKEVDLIPCTNRSLAHHYLKK